MKKISIFGSLLVFFIAAVSSTTIEDNGKAGVTGSPSETTCNTAGCHTGNGTSGSAVFTSNIPAAGYVPGTTYNITLTVSEAGKNLFGLGVEALTAANANGGTLVITNTASTQIKSKTIGGVSRKNVVHTNNGGVGTGTKAFNFNWVAPATAADGVVTFYYAGLSADGDGNEDSGDNTYAGSKSFGPQGVSAASSPEAFGISVSPSPAYDNLKIDLGSAIADKMSIHNLNGVEVWNIGSSSGIVDIALPSMNAGTYVLTMHVAGKVLVKKIFIARS